jgi:hypothetical protein
MMQRMMQRMYHFSPAWMGIGSRARGGSNGLSGPEDPMPAQGHSAVIPSDKLT